jgi:hypothetical protein
MNEIMMSLSSERKYRIVAAAINREPGLPSWSLRGVAVSEFGRHQRAPLFSEPNV